MRRPPLYNDRRVTTENIPYEQEERHAGGVATTGGVLAKGRTVWVQAHAADRLEDASARPNAILAYVDEMGLVSVDPRRLAPSPVAAARRKPVGREVGLHLVGVQRVNQGAPSTEESVPHVLEGELAG